MNRKNLSPRRKGQSMVEFALVLPVLLLVVLGLLEAGRLIFIYGSVTTASRQAVRYGSATGDNGAGTNTRKYLDCDGIETAAKDMGFILPIDTVDIIYTRDGNPFADCDTGSSTYPNPTADLFENGDRIEVTTTSPYAPIVPIAGFANFDLVANSKRTIFVGISISAEAAPWVPTAAIQLEGFAGLKSPPDATIFVDNPTYTLEGQEFEFKFKLTNTGDTELTSYSITTDIGNCSGGNLAIGASVDCYPANTYVITSDNYTNGEAITINANADASDGTNTPTALTAVVITFDPTAQISLSGAVNPAVQTTEGPVTFTYTITNTGGVDLSTFSLETISGVPVTFTCETGILPALGTDTILCSGTYTITQADLDAGLVTNEAKATATDGGPNSSTDTASATVITKPLKLTITTDPLAYDITTDTEIEFNYTLENVGDVPLSDLSLTSVLFGNITICNNGVNLANTTLASKGDKVSCKMVYTPISQTDMDNSYLDDDATGHAEGGTIDSNMVEERILATISPDLLLEIIAPIDKSVIPDGTTTITYTYKLTNTGNMTLKETYEIRDSNNTVLCAGTFLDLAPGYSDTSCSYTYNIVDPDDWNAGSIVSNVTAYTQYTPPNPPYTSPTPISVTSNTVNSTVYTFDGDRMTLEITSSSGDNPVDFEEEIILTYTLKNTGNTTLYPTYTLTNALTAHDFGLCFPAAGAVPPGGIIFDECTIFYQVVDVEADNTLINTTTATASNQENGPANVQTTTTLILDVIPVPVCSEDQWTSSKKYASPDQVYYCGSDGVCNEWRADQEPDPSTGEGESGHVPGGFEDPPYWIKTNRCKLEYSCQVSLTNIPMDNNSSTQSLTIVNASNVSVEINSIYLTWASRRLRTVVLGGENIFSGNQGTSGFDPLSPNTHLTIGPGNPTLQLTFNNRTNWARAVITFSDNLCKTHPALDSGLP